MAIVHSGTKVINANFTTFVHSGTKDLKCPTINSSPQWDQRFSSLVHSRTKDLKIVQFSSTVLSETKELKLSLSSLSLF